MAIQSEVPWPWPHVRSAKAVRGAEAVRSAEAVRGAMAVASCQICRGSQWCRGRAVDTRYLDVQLPADQVEGDLVEVDRHHTLKNKGALPKEKDGDGHH